MTHDPPTLAAYQFQRVGVPLLRHQAGASRVSIIHFYKAELAAGPQDEILRQATEVYLRQPGPGQELDDVIPIPHSVYAVLTHADETQFGSQSPAVYVERIPGQRARPQRANLRAPRRVVQPLPVALELPEEGHQPVAKEQRLRRLQVGVAGHDHVQVSLGLLDDGLLQFDQRIAQGGHLVQQVEAQVGGHLVVTGAAGVQFPCHRAHQLGQPPLNRGVDVLVAGLDLKVASVELSAHLLQAGDELVALLVCDQPCPRQRAGVGDAPPDVGLVHPPVEANRLAEAPHQSIRGILKTTAP